MAAGDAGVEALTTSGGIPGMNGRDTALDGSG
jgi:hypothetical protein